MLTSPKIGFEQKIVIVALLCLAFGIAAFDGQSSQQVAVLPTSEHQHQQAAGSASENENKPDKVDWDNWTRDPITVFTGLLTLFNGLLFASTIGLWLQARRSARIAEMALTGLERPRVMLLDLSFGIVNDAKRAQIGLINLGRDPGHVIQIDGKFFTNELPESPNFTEAQTERPDTWLLPASAYDQPRQGRVGYLFIGDKGARFFAVNILYEWDFGRYEYAFAYSAGIAPAEIPKSVGGSAWNYENKRT
jgi:hypothetical protein